MLALVLNGCSATRSSQVEGESDRVSESALPADPLDRRIALLERRITREQERQGAGTSLAPTIAKLEAELGELYLEDNDLRRARRNFRLARYDAPRAQGVATRVGLGLAEVYLREGQDELALEELEQLEAERSTLSPQDELRWRAFASLAYERTGRAAEAQKLRPNSIDEVAFSALRRRAGGKDLARASAKPSSNTTPAPAPSGAVQVLPRSAWNPATARNDQDVMGAVRRITIHHSAMDPTGSALSEAAKQIRSIQNAHFQRGYADIGYHFLIDSQGRVWEGRDRRFQGAHAGNKEANQRNLGICLLGNFVSMAPTPAQDRALRSLVAVEAKRYNVPKNQIFGHGEVRKYFTGDSTECPGERLMTVVRQMRGGAAGNLAED